MAGGGGEAVERNLDDFVMTVEGEGIADGDAGGLRRRQCRDGSYHSENGCRIFADHVLWMVSVRPGFYMCKDT